MIGALAERVIFFFNVKHFSSKKIFCSYRQKHGDINIESPLPLFLKLKAKYNTGNHSQISW